MRDHLLCIHIGAVGDLVLAIPALATLRGTFSRMTVACTGTRGSIPVMAGCADECLDIESYDLWRLLARPDDLSDTCTEFMRRYNAAVVWVADTDGGLRQALAACGIERAIVEPGVPPAEWNQHAGRYYLHTVEPFGVAPSSPESHRLEPGADADRWVEERIGSTDSPLIAIHPGSGSRKKCWPIDRFTQIARWIRNELGARIVWLTGPAESGTAPEEIRAADDDLVLHNPSYPQLVAVLNRCRLYLGNDSGPTHLAAAARVPTVAMFGPTDPAVWAPLGDRVTTVAGSVPCAPCTPGRRRKCKNPECMNAIPVEAVQVATTDLLSYRT